MVVIIKAMFFDLDGTLLNSERVGPVNIAGPKSDGARFILDNKEK